MNTTTFPILTERLLLRKFEIADTHEMFRLDSNPNVHKYLGEGWMNKSIEDAVSNVKSIINQYKVRGIGRWAAIEKSSGKFIGWSGLKLNAEEEMNGYTNFYDIGYRLLPEFWGKGYATESSIAALDFGFKTLNLDTIYGITHIENEASHRVLLKIGMRMVNTFYQKSENLNLRWYELNRDEYNKSMP